MTPSWPTVLQALLDTAGPASDLTDLALRWLSHAPADHQQVVSLLQHLLSVTPHAAEQAAVDWLRIAAADSPGWNYVLQSALKTLGARPPLLDLAFTYLHTRPRSDSAWVSVLQALLAVPNPPAWTAAIATDWLIDTDPMQPAWPYVLQAALRTPHLPPPVVELAARWLMWTSPTEPAWNYLLQQAVLATGRAPGLVLDARWAGWTETSIAPGPRGFCAACCSIRTLGPRQHRGCCDG